MAGGPAYTYSFDGAGNRHSRVDGSGNTLTYNYDQLNRLTGYVPSGPTPPTYGYTYNGDGLRMAKSTSGSSTAGFTWDVAEGLPLLLSDGSTSYITGPGGLPIEQVTASGTLYFYQADQLGSTRLITNASGASVDTYTYDAYGNLTASTGSLANPFQFAGQYLDSESGLYYLSARFYEPASGQFISRDPMVSITKAPYAYVGDTPLNGTDPAGLAWWNQAAATVVGGVGGFVGNAVDNLHSGNPALVALGVAESVVIAAPIAAGITVAGGGAIVGAGLDATASAIPILSAEAASTIGVGAITPAAAAAEATGGAATTATWGASVWGSGAVAARLLIGTRGAEELEALGLTPRLACGLRAFYQAAAGAGKGGETAGARAELMDSVLRTLLGT